MRLILTNRERTARAIVAYLSHETGAVVTNDEVAHLVGDTDVVIPLEEPLYVDYTPEEYDPRYRFSECRLEDLPIIPKPWRIKAATSERACLTFKALNTYAPQAHLVLHACDLDLDGQLIGDQVIRNYSLQLPTERLPLTGLDEHGLRRAFRRLAPNEIYLPLTTAATARRRADWLWGMNLSRLFTYHARRAGYKKAYVKAGRVISGILYLLAQYERTILTHHPLTHYEVKAKVIVDGTPLAATWVPPSIHQSALDPDGRLADKRIAQSTLEQLARNRDGSIVNIAQRETHAQPPAPSTLGALQSAAGKLYGYSAAEVQKAARALYQDHRLITYPHPALRTLPTTLHAAAPQLLDILRQNLPALAAVIEGCDLGRRSNAFADPPPNALATPHAIAPCHTRLDVNRLTPIERDVYELIARTFVAQLFPPATTLHRTILCTFDGQTLRADLSTVTTPGWRPLMGRTALGAGLRFDNLSTGVAVTIENAAILTRTTQPPPRLHDYDLIEKINDPRSFADDPTTRQDLNGVRLGTDAGQASVIERLVECDLLTIDADGLLHVTPFGLTIADALPAELHGSRLTAQWEAELAKVADGAGNGARFLLEQTKLITNIVSRKTSIPYRKTRYRSPGHAR